MIQLLIVTLLTAISSCITASAASLLLEFNPATSHITRSNALRHYGLTDITPDSLSPCRLVHNHSGMSWQHIHYLMRSQNLITYIEPNKSYTTTTFPNDPLFKQQWALHNTRYRNGRYGTDIKALPAWKFKSKGDPIIVAIIDTGTDYLHPDLKNIMWHNSDEIANNGVDDDKNGYVDDTKGWNFYNNTADPMDITSHGTHCAGIIAAIHNNNTGITGVSNHVRIMPLRCASPWETLPTSAIVPAIRYAADNGAHIINASWGGYGYSQALTDAIQYAHDKGVLFVAAAGNNGVNIDRYPFYPAGYNLPNLISVAASDQFDHLSPWSNYGAQKVDLAAPGNEIYSTVSGGRYAAWSGTSMATPHVCGVAALLLAYNDQLLPEQIVHILTSTTEPLQKTNSRNIGATNGRLNAQRALAIAPSITNILPASVQAYLHYLLP